MTYIPLCGTLYLKSSVNEQGEKYPQGKWTSLIIFFPQSGELKFQRKGGRIFTEYSKLEAEDQLKAFYFSILIKISKTKSPIKNNIAPLFLSSLISLNV